MGAWTRRGLNGSGEGSTLRTVRTLRTLGTSTLGTPGTIGTTGTIGARGTLPYRPQLDGLRAVAVAAVAWSHWERPYQFGIPFGDRRPSVLRPQRLSHHRHSAERPRTRRPDGRAQGLLHSPRAANLPGVLSHARACVGRRHPARPRYLLVACALRLERPGRDERRVAGRDQSLLVACGRRAVLPGVAVADRLCAPPLARAGDSGRDCVRAGVPVLVGHARLSRDAAWGPDAWLARLAGRRALAGARRARPSQRTGDGGLARSVVRHFAGSL